MSDLPEDPARRSLLLGAAAVAAASPALAVTPVMAPPSLTGRSVLITGASSGFGYLAAQLLARQGASVFATMRKLPRPEATALADLARAEGLKLTVLELDVTNDAQVARAVAEAERLAGGALDVVVNNAGIGISGPVEVHDMAATQLAFDTNVFGVHRVTRAALPAMRAKKAGLIINISSQLGRVIVPFGGHYSATKFALEAMSEQLAYELTPHGVEVSIIQPGGYPTNVWRNRNVYTGALKERAEPMHANGYPQVVARMGTEDGSGRSADPMDVPRAMLEIIALPAGRRPLRRAVHPGPKPQEPINALTAQVQRQMLGRGAFKPWVEAVLD